MKKSFLISCIAVLLLASCTTTEMVTPYSEYTKKVEELTKEITDTAYFWAGFNFDNKNTLVVANQTFNSTLGYSNELRNKTDYYDHYVYKKKDGTTLDYTVRYRMSQQYNDSLYIHDLSLVGCNCDNEEDFSSFCLKKIPAIQDLPKYEKKEVSIMSVVAITAAICGLITIIALTAN